MIFKNTFMLLFFSIQQNKIKILYSTTSNRQKFCTFISLQNSPMKLTRFFLKGLILLTFLISNNSFGQLSGTVTVNANAPVSASNFTNFTSLADTLNLMGVSGPLVVNVAPNSGPYIEQPIFYHAPGISSTHSITINGNNNILTYTNTSQGGGQDWALLLNGADYMNFNDLKMSSYGVFHFAVACHLCAGADYNSFNNCTFSCKPNNTTFQELALAITVSTNVGSTPGSGNAGSFNTFSNCTMYSGSYGVLLTGPSNTPYSTGNSFINCYMTDWSYYGIRADYQENLTIKSCHIDRPTRPEFAVGYGLGFIQTPGGLVCENNCIENLAGGFPASTGHIHGIYYENYAMPSGLAPSTLSNNIISNIVTNDKAYGIQLVNFNGSCLSNIIELNNGNSTYTAECYGLHVTPGTSSTDSLKVIGNHFSLSHQGTGQKYCAYYTSLARTKVDNNTYYIAPGNSSLNHIGYLNTTASTFVQWQAQGLDLHGTSYSVSPYANNPISCSSASIATSLANITQFKKNEIRIFPNPVSTHLYLELAKEEFLHIEIIDLAGRTIFSMLSENNKVKINTSNFDSGIYFVKVIAGNYSNVTKIIKE
jgi:hypothetical protein